MVKYSLKWVKLSTSTWLSPLQYDLMWSLQICFLCDRSLQGSSMICLRDYAIWIMDLNSATFYMTIENGFWFIYIFSQCTFLHYYSLKTRQYIYTFHIFLWILQLTLFKIKWHHCLSEIWDKTITELAKRLIIATTKKQSLDSNTRFDCQVLKWLILCMLLWRSFAHCNKTCIEKLWQRSPPLPEDTQLEPWTVSEATKVK